MQYVKGRRQGKEEVCGQDETEKLSQKQKTNRQDSVQTQNKYRKKKLNNNKTKKTQKKKARQQTVRERRDTRYKKLHSNNKQTKVCLCVCAWTK